MVPRNRPLSLHLTRLLYTRSANQVICVVMPNDIQLLVGSFEQSLRYSSWVTITNTRRTRVKLGCSADHGERSPSTLFGRDKKWSRGPIMADDFQPSVVGSGRKLTQVLFMANDYRQILEPIPSDNIHSLTISWLPNNTACEPNS